MSYTDYDRIFGSLFMGSRPPEGAILARLGFQVVVLCADSFQPPSSAFPELLEVIHAPFHDAPGFGFKPAERLIAEDAGRRVAAHVRKGRKVLVSCEMGINRSGLVTAIALHRGTGMGGLEARKVIRSRRQVRPEALWNPHFVDYLQTIYPHR